MIDDYDDTRDVRQHVPEKHGDTDTDTPEPEDWRPLGYEW